MREYLFRGKRKDNGEWVEGYYCQFHNRPIVNEPNTHQIFELKENARIYGSSIGGLWHIVYPKTVGQYTGFTDKNGKKIFEGDIIQFCTGMKLHYIVEFDLGGFMLSRYDKCGEIIDVYNCPCEVIGNIHDDPELLKVGDGE